MNANDEQDGNGVSERFEALRRAGGFLPVSLAARLVGVSRTRVDQLVARGVLTLVVFCGWRVISVSSLLRWYRRKAKRKLRP